MGEEGDVSGNEAASVGSILTLVTVTQHQVTCYNKEL